MTEVKHISQIALFIDLDNIDAAQGGFRYPTKLEPLLEWFKNRGKVVIRRAYGSWGVYQRYLRQLKDLSIESIHLRGGGMVGKNLADVRMAIDLTEMIFTHPNIDIFAIVTGDSDFTPVLHRLSERGKYVIGVGFRQISSPHLVEQCDEFIYYDTLLSSNGTSETRAEIIDHGTQLLRQVMQKLARNGITRAPANRVKAAIKEIAPDFKESSWGFKQFKDFLQYYPSVVTLEQEGNLLLVRAVEETGVRMPPPVHKTPTAPKRKEAAPPDAITPYEEVQQALTKVMKKLAKDDELPVNPSRVQEELVKFIPAFDTKDYNFSKFRHFLEANPDSVQVISQENGALVVDSPDASSAAPEIPTYAVVQSNLAELMAELEEEDALPMNIGRLKQLLMSRLPNFDERNYRFDKFLSLLQDNPDIVQVERRNDSAWRADRAASPLERYRHILRKRKPTLIAPDLRWQVMLQLYSLLQAKPRELSRQQIILRLVQYHQQKGRPIDPEVVTQVVDLAIRGGAVQRSNGDAGQEKALTLKPNLRREELVVRCDSVYLSRFLEEEPEFDNAVLAQVLFGDTPNGEDRLNFMLNWLKRTKN